MAGGEVSKMKTLRYNGRGGGGTLVDVGRESDARTQECDHGW